MTRSRIAVLAVLVLVAGALLAFDASPFLSLDHLRQQQAALEQWRAARPWLAASSYFAIYVAVTALSLPGAALMTLAGGAMFGLLWGTILVSFASTLGATAAFLVSRFLLREAVHGRFGERLRAINAGMEREKSVAYRERSMGARLAASMPSTRLNGTCSARERHSSGGVDDAAGWVL